MTNNHLSSPYEFAGVFPPDSPYRLTTAEGTWEGHITGPAEGAIIVLGRHQEEAAWRTVNIVADLNEYHRIESRRRWWEKNRRS